MIRESLGSRRSWVRCLAVAGLGLLPACVSVSAREGSYQLPFPVSVGPVLRVGGSASEPLPGVREAQFQNESFDKLSGAGGSYRSSPYEVTHVAASEAASRRSNGASLAGAAGGVRRPVAIVEKLVVYAGVWQAICYARQAAEVSVSGSVYDSVESGGER